MRERAHDLRRESKLSRATIAPGPEFEWRPHLVRGRFAFEVLVDRSALLKQRRVTDRAAGIGGRPSAAGRAIACVCELAPFLGRAKGGDTGRAGGLRLSQLTLEGGVLTLDVGEPGLECSEAVLDGRARARRRGHSQRNEEADHSCAADSDAVWQGVLKRTGR